MNNVDMRREMGEAVSVFLKWGPGEPGAFFFFLKIHFSLKEVGWALVDPIPLKGGFTNGGHVTKSAKNAVK